MNQVAARRAELDRSAISRYIQLATLFRRRIESGQWKVKEQIPTVDELAKECGVARATIRQAVGILEAEGLVARYRAKGTFVLSRSPQGQLWCEVETNWQGLLSSREGAQIEILAEGLVDAPNFLPHDIGTTTQQYKHLKRRHSLNGTAFLVADVYVDAKLAQRLPKSAFTTKTALRLAASIPKIRIVQARQTLTIGTADFETAQLMNLPLNAAVAHVNRSAVDQHGRLILVANGIYRGDVVRVDVKLK
jgi:GntR family transcriptional regulator